MTPVLSMWVVYDRPRDFPNHVVAREHVVTADHGTKVAPTCELFTTIEQARTAMLNRGLGCIGRQPDDEPHIVEVWL